MYHAAAGDLQPAAVFADAAARAAAEEALDVNLHAGLGEGEVGSAIAHARVLAEHAPGEGGDGALEVGHADAAPDRQALHLVELQLTARGDLLVAIAHAGQNDADGARAIRAQLAHGVDLAWRGVRAHDDAGRGRIEGILHVARGMMRRKVQELEVEFVRLHVAAAVDLKAHLAPDAGELAQRARRGVQAAFDALATGQRDVDLAFLKVLRQFGRPHGLLARFVSHTEQLADLVGALAKGRPLLLRQLPGGTQHGGDGAATPQPGALPGFQRLAVADVGEGLQRFRILRFKLLKHVWSPVFPSSGQSLTAAAGQIKNSRPGQGRESGSRGTTLLGRKIAARSSCLLTPAGGADY